MNRKPFESGEWYHCYSRGVDKRKVFQNSRDFSRFTAHLYAANSRIPIHLSNFIFKDLSSLVEHPDVRKIKREPLVEIGAYCIMSNHVHLVIQEIQENGISLFMQKVFTGYTMYFNKKNDRTGALFSGTFKSKHIDSDEYLQHVIHYIHLNPIEIFELDWKKGRGNLREIEENLKRYAHSSFACFDNQTRPERQILGSAIFDVYRPVPIKTMLNDAQEYYAESASWQG